MNLLPSTDQSADPVAGPGKTPAHSTGSEDTLRTPLDRLRTAARTAGLHLHPGYPEDSPDRERLLLGDADEATVRELAAILSTAGATSRTAPAPPGIGSAAAWLRTCARAADVELRPGVPGFAAGGRAVLPLGDADQGTATRLAELIEQHLAGLHSAEEALRNALDRIGVTAEQLATVGGAINLGDVTIAESVALLQRLLPNARVRQVDPDDQYTSEVLAARLTEAVREITGDAFIHATYSRTGHDWPALVLGKLRPRDARSLTAHLTRSAA